ncbi:toprim domain-containing protein [Novipirellula caenicola]|uniref:DUF3991 domain-containing protein n=1 Tax=Novipirellula caenicola TaxID=1536901 RepID=A0ABP9VRV3_9BACT
MNRFDELDAFKKINLSLIASAFGFVIDRRKSTKHSVLMQSGAEKIIIAQNGAHYVYCSVHDSKSNGTAIDFIQRVVEPGCSLGRVRQLLRPYLNGANLGIIAEKYRDCFATTIRSSESDLLGVASRYSQFEPLESHHRFLCDTRGIPLPLLLSDHLRGCIRHSPRHGSVIFPHWGAPHVSTPDDRCLTGFEIKGPGVNMFSKGGRKSLWMSTGKPTDNVLTFAESAIDAVSYLVLHGQQDQTRVASISGQFNPDQPALIRSAMNRMEEGSRVVAAFDNDEAGDRMTQTLSEMVIQTERTDLQFVDHRPVQRGEDWNEVLKQREPGPQYSLA